MSSGGREVKQVLDIKVNVHPPPNTPTSQNHEDELSDPPVKPKTPGSKSKKGKAPYRKAMHKIITNWDDLDFTSTESDSEIETESRSSHSRTLRKTRSRGKGKGDKDFSLGGDYAFDNHGYASEGDKEARALRRAKEARRKPGRKECWS